MSESAHGRSGGRSGSPLATAEQTARQPAPFPTTSTAEPMESGFPDWRRRLSRNLSRRSDGRWEPLTRTSAPKADDDDPR